MVTKRMFLKHTYEIGRSKYQLSRGKMCVANFIPPANGASLGMFKTEKMQKEYLVMKKYC